MPLYTQGGKLIRVGSALKGCCCDGTSPCCCQESRGKTLTGQFGSDGACGSYLDGRTLTLDPSTTDVTGVICAAWQGRTTPLPNCGTGIVVAIEVRIRCNPDLPTRTSGLCDKYEAKVFWQASPCTATPDWYRVNSGCTCNPLSLVFTLPTPSNGGLSAGCDCCANPTVTFTVTL